MDLRKKVEKINETEDLRLIGEVFNEINEENLEEILQNINIDHIHQTIEQSKDLSEIAYLLEQAGRSAEGLKNELQRGFSFERIRQRIKKAPSLGIILLFDQFSKDLIVDLIKTIGWEALLDKVDSARSTWAIGRFLKMMREISLTLSKQLIRDIDLEKLSKNIKEEVNVWGITLCLRETFKIDPKTWECLLQKVDLHHLARKAEKTNATEIGRLVETLSLREEVGKRLVNYIDLDKVAKRMKEGRNTLYLLHILENFLSLEERRGKELLGKIDLEMLAKEINKEPQGFRRYAVRTLDGIKEAEPLVAKINVS